MTGARGHRKFAIEYRQAFRHPFYSFEFITSFGLRLVPMSRDLRFAWEAMPQQLLDKQAQKVRDSLRAALITWAETQGSGSDYPDNLPLPAPSGSLGSLV